MTILSVLGWRKEHLRGSLVARVPARWRPALRFTWHHVTLRGSRRLVEWRMRWKARNPRTFNQRLHYKMLFDRRPLLTLLADKVEVREHITACAGTAYVSEMIAVAERTGDIPWSDLPREYVIKVNHGSGGIVMVTSDAPMDARLPPVGSRMDWARFRVRPEHADAERLADLCSHWLTLDYSWAQGHASIQWCYQDIRRRIMCEELLRNDLGEHPSEYRLFVINGTMRFIQAEIDIFGDKCTAMMSPDWNVLPVRFVDPPPAVPPARPESLGLMIMLAEALAEVVVDFVRVDLYDLGSRIVVGEMTHYPSGGCAPMSSRAYAKFWGRGWRQEY